jgi:uncharacterized protein DUF3885
MKILRSFDLPQFMFSHFPRVDFGGDLFGQWPVGIRFEIGLENVSRATKIHEFLFGEADDCILVFQEWLSDRIDLGADRSTLLFSTPGVFPNGPPSEFQAVDVSPFEETPHRLTWARLPLNSFNATQMFQAVANRERGGIPAIGSGVYALDDRAKLIIHMYDDRGLDVIAADPSTLVPLYQRFGDWILENQRRKIDLRFREVIAAPPS